MLATVVKIVRKSKPLHQASSANNRKRTKWCCPTFAKSRQPSSITSARAVMEIRISHLLQPTAMDCLAVPNGIRWKPFRGLRHLVGNAAFGWRVRLSAEEPALPAISDRLIRHRPCHPSVRIHRRLLLQDRAIICIIIDRQPVRPTADGQVS